MAPEFVSVWYFLGVMGEVPSRTYLSKYVNKGSKSLKILKIFCLFMYALCKHVCKYASIQVCKYASMQVCKYARMEKGKYANIPKYKFKSGLSLSFIFIGIVIIH